MGISVSKGLVVILLLVLVCSTVIPSGIVCASTPKPSVPEFTLKYADYSYNVPATYGIDPYTGKSIITAQGHEIVNRTVYFTIKNQLFTPIDSSGTPVNLYYHIRYKGHYENSWNENSQETDGNTILHDTLVFPTSNSSYTEISVVRYLVDGFSNDAPLNYVRLPEEGLVDFQVQAIIGRASIVYPELLGGILAAPIYSIRGQIGDWSATQTITIGENTGTTTPDVTSPFQSLSPSESQNPTPTRSSTQIVIQLGGDWVLVVIILLIGVIVGLLLLLTIKSTNKHRDISPS